MKQLVAATLGFGIIVLGIPAVGEAADQCPPELTQAKAALKGAQASLKKAPEVAKGQDVQAPRSPQASARAQDVQAPRAQDIQSPRSQAGAKSQDVQAPRGQDIQSPRGQDIQAPRGQDIQSPRSQDIQSPRSQDIQAPRGQQEIPVPRGQEIQAPRVKQASALVQESEAACKKGDLALSTRKAKEALGLLKK
jgi:hypothetical protein